jgi:hypothetical protein
METRDEHLEFLLYRVEAMSKEIERLKLENLILSNKLEYYDNRNEVLTLNYNYLSYGN